MTRSDTTRSSFPPPYTSPVSRRHAAATRILSLIVTVAVPAAALLGRGAPYVRVAPWIAEFTAAAALLPLALIISTIERPAANRDQALAPQAPLRRMAVRGPYRFVRNPRAIGVAGVLAAAAGVTQSGIVAGALVLCVLASAIHVPVVEERRLLARFGDAYGMYARNVPRWLPRLTAWNGRDDGIPRRAPDELILATVPALQVRGLVLMHALAVAAMLALAVLLVWSALAGGPGVQWVLVALAATWAVLDLRDAWTDALRDPPPPLLFGRLRDDGTTFELRDAPDGRPVAGWRFVRREKGAFVLMRRRLASRALVKHLRPRHRPFRMAQLYEPQGRPDGDGWIRYPASAAWQDPPGAWQALEP